MNQLFYDFVFKFSTDQLYEMLEVVLKRIQEKEAK